MVVMVVFLMLTSLAAASTDAKVAAIATRVDKHYNSLQTFQADFVESYSGNGTSREESGRLTLKRPGKMRWDYRQPTEKLFVSDGKTAYFYVPGEKPARRTSMKNLDDLRSPLRYLLGKTKLEKEFNDLGLADGEHPSVAANVLLAGVPKQMTQRISRVLLEITSQNLIQRIVIQEVDGSVTEFRFSNILENQEVADRQFRFDAPKGVETIEAGAAFSF